MPIEIRELHIKAVIDTGGKKTNKAQPPGAMDAKAAGEGGGQNAEQIVALCVEKVLEILKEKEER